MKRKILSLILVFAMTVSLLTVGTGAVEPTYGDTAGHWAESSIERWSGHGIIQGSNGLFDPNGQLTCAQLATILAKLLKLPVAKDAGFTDNTADAWYYDAINRCAAAGILNGNGDGTVTPDAPISRERAIVMLGRALGIEPISKPDPTKYTDAAKVAPYAQGMVAAMIEAGIVGGVTADELAPQDNINRASTVTILDRAIGTYADKAGATVKADGKGIVLVVADDVTVTGDVDKLLVPADNVDVTVSGSKNIDDITVTGDNSKVILNNSTANDVTLDGKNTELETKSGSKVENVSVTEDAKGATVNAGSGTTIGTVDSKADNVSISGDGKVENASVSGDNTKVNTKDTKVDVDEGVTGTTAGGKEVAGGTTTETKPSTPSGSSSSSGGSSHSHTIATAWSYDDTYHWHEADCGLESHRSGKAAHKFDEATGACECGFTKCVEVWTGYSGTKVASYATIAEAAENLGENKWIVISKNYTLTKDFTIPEGVFLDVAENATLTVAENVTLTVAENAKRLGVRTDATVVNNGTIMVCGTSYSNGYVMVQDSGVLDTTKLSVPEGCFLDNNGSNYFATANENALYEITYIDGTVKKTADRSHVNKNATQVKLLKDVEVSSWVLSNVADNFVLDLGGHTLSGSKTSGSYVLYAGVNMTIKNGTIKYNAGSEKGAICVYYGATVTIDSTATIDGGSGIGIMMQGETPSHVVLNGTVTTTGAYGFASNGSANSDGNPDTCNITVNAGATIKASKGFAIYHPTLGTVTVNGGTISGHTGIEMCAGKLVVSGGSITSTGDNTDATGSQNAILDGAAISIINRNYPGGVPTAEITGGTIKATGTGMTVKAYDYKNDTVASWTDVSNYVNISGGTFSSDPSAYVAEGYSAIPDGESAWKVVEGNYVTVTPENVPSPFQANTTYLFTAGDYGEQHFVITDKENVTLIGQSGAEFGSLQISSIDYVNSGIGQEVDLADSTLTVKGFNVSKTLMIVVSDKNVVVTDNVAAQITVKTNVSCTGIAVNANKLTGGENAAQKYGVYVVPNITNYDLTITGNTFENIAKHAISVQGCGDGSAVTAANSITVEDNQFNSYGTDKGSRAAFKIWEDTKLAPDSTSELNDAAKALAASVQAKNIFAATLDGSCILADFYGKTVPFSSTSPM